jgi:cysteine desulfurase
VIYADNAATTKISDFAFEMMLPFLREQYGNASSQYSLGVNAKRAVEQSRWQVAEAIGTDISEIVFTSGGSEGNSWVLQGVSIIFSGEPIHIIPSSIEHHSVLNACHTLEDRKVFTTYLPADSNGRVSIDDVESALCPDTKLVSVMLANNEIGTIQPIQEIGKLLREKSILFHTDAVQAVGHIPVNVKDLQVDFLTASAHKFNGAKGTGFIYIRSGVDLPQLVFGGGQEQGYRASTENAAGIVALGYALEENISNMVSERERLTSLLQATANGLNAAIPGLLINAENAERFPGTQNVIFPHASGESMLHLLDLKGICISTSSACNSGKDKPSHVLLALGLTEEQTKSSIRISYGKYNTTEDAEKIVAAINNAYAKIMAMRSTE